MPFAPVGRILLTEPLPIVEGVYIPDALKHQHELPPKDTVLDIYGRGASELAAILAFRRHVRLVKDVETHSGPVIDRPQWRLWRADPWVEDVRAGAPCEILDFGCGSGRDAVALASQGHQVTAYDILPDALDRGRDLERRYGDGLPINWLGSAPERLFDLVILMRCGRPSLIERAWQHVRPGGRMWVTTREMTMPGAEVLMLQSEGEWTRAELLRQT